MLLKVMTSDLTSLTATLTSPTSSYFVFQSMLAQELWLNTDKAVWDYQDASYSFPLVAIHLVKAAVSGEQDLHDACAKEE